MNVIEEAKIVKVDDKTWKFPESIKYETAATYNDMFSEIKSHEIILFDLSGTQVIHSSFIGFLIDLKQRLESEGGELRIEPSPAFERLLSILDLNNFFLGNREA